VNQTRNQKGVTLIELLVVLIIMVGISAITFKLFSYTSSLEQAVSKRNELQREAMFVMETISNAVRDGGIITPNGNQILINKEIDSAMETQMIYNQSTKLLTLSSNNSVISKNVSSFDVVYPSNTNGRTNYYLKLVLESGKYKYTISTEVFDNETERIIR
jgi:prepilin-type N-terminal cleavage/methylation domain-containing protein